MDLYNSTFRNVINENEWSHLSGVYDSTSQHIQIYVNGILKNTTDVGGSYNLNNSSNNLIIGEGLTGYMDDIRVYDEARSASQVKADFTGKQTPRGASGRSVTVGESADSSEGLIAHWKFDETALNSCGTNQDACDATGNLNHLSAIADAAPTTTAKYGYAATFDGTGDYYCSDPDDDGACEDDDDLDMGTSDFTIEAWVKTSSSAQHNGIVSKWSGSGTQNSYRLVMRDEASFGGAAGRLSFVIYDDGGAGDYVYTTKTVNDGNWHHVVATRDDNNMYIYIDGALSNANDDTSSVDLANTTQLSIGYGYSSGWPFTGQIDDVKIYNVARSASQIRKDYETGPPPVAHWRFDENVGQTAYDTSENSNDGTLTNMDTANSWVSGQYGSALSFDGVDDYVDVASVDFKTQSFSAEAWIKTTDTSAMPVSYQNTSGYYGWYILFTGAVVRGAVVASNGALLASVDATVTVTDDVWHYVSLTDDGSTIKLYVDGVEINSGSSATKVWDTTMHFYAGAQRPEHASPLYWLDGTIDDVRIYNYARTQKQILEDMNAGHPAVGSPVGSYVGHWSFDEMAGDTAYDMSISQNNGTLLGEMATSSATNSGWQNECKFSGCLAFDGADDYVDLGTINTGIGTGDYAVSMWFKASSEDTLTLISFADNSPSMYAEYVTDNNVGIFSEEDTVYGGDGYEYTDITWLDNSWNHAVFVRESGVVYVYLNGIKSGLSIADDETSIDNVAVNIGRRINDNDRYCDGLIDEVRIYPFALTPAEVKQEYNRGATLQLGSVSTEADGTTASQAASREYCIPGDTSTCLPPVAHWKFDEKTGQYANDISTSTNTGTLGSSAGADASDPVWKSAASCHSGACLSFDGVDDYVNCGTNTILDLTGDLTIEAWIYPEGWGDGNYGRIFERGGPSKGYSLLLRNGGGEEGLWFAALGGDNAYSNNSVISLNSWQHAAVTRLGASVTFYVDGVNSGSGTVSSISSGGSISALIGDEYGLARSFNGLIDDVRIYNYARTPAQIAWDYNRGKPIAHYKMDEGQDTETTCDATGSVVYDYSYGCTQQGTCNHGFLNNATGSQATTWSEGKYGCSLDFDGVDDYVQISNDSTISFTGTSFFSVCAWVNLDDTSSNDWILNKQVDVRNEFAYGFLLYSGKLAFSTGRQGTGANIKTADNAANTDQWYHMCGVFNATHLRLYVDGVIQGDPLADVYNGNAQTSSLFFGQMYNNTLRLDGTIDDVRIYNYTLTPLQVKLLYNEGAAVRFGPPTGLP